MPRVLRDDWLALVVVFHLLVSSILPLRSGIGTVHPMGLFLVGRATDSWGYRFARERSSCPD